LRSIAAGNVEPQLALPQAMLAVFSADGAMIAVLRGWSAMISETCLCFYIK
jgi:hypothetical protein